MAPELVPQSHGGALRKGGGRPPGAKNKAVTALREAMFGPEDTGVIPVLIKKALDGDMRALELCLSYGIGKPTEKVEVTGQDGGAIFLAPVLARLSDDELDAAARRIAGGLDDDPARAGEAEEPPEVA